MLEWTFASIGGEKILGQSEEIQTKHFAIATGYLRKSPLHSKWPPSESVSFNFCYLLVTCCIVCVYYLHFHLFRLTTYSKKQKVKNIAKSTNEKQTLNLNVRIVLSKASFRTSFFSFWVGSSSPSCRSRIM